MTPYPIITPNARPWSETAAEIQAMCDQIPRSKRDTGQVEGDARGDNNDPAPRREDKRLCEEWGDAYREGSI